MSIVSEVSQTEKEKYQMTSHMWNLKRTYFQNRKRLIDLENELMWEGIVRGFGKVMYTLLCSKFKNTIVNDHWQVNFQIKIKKIKM